MVAKLYLVENASTKDQDLLAFQATDRYIHYIVFAKRIFGACDLSARPSSTKKPRTKQTSQVAMFETAVRAQQAADYDSAIPVYNDLVDRCGASGNDIDIEITAKSLYNRAAINHVFYRWRECFALYDNVIENFYDSNVLAVREPVAKSFYNKGVRLAETGSMEEAIAEYDRAIDHYARQPLPSLLDLLAHAVINKGLALDALERYEEAISVYGQLPDLLGEIRDLYPYEALANALELRASAYRHGLRKDLCAALEDEVIIRFGAESHPRLRQMVAESLFRKGTALASWGDFQIEAYEAAISTFNQILLRYNGDDEIDINLRALLAKAAVRTTEGRLEEAFAIYEEVESRLPEAKDQYLRARAADLQIQKGRIHAKKGRHRDAFSSFDAVLSGLYGPIAAAERHILSTERNESIFLIANELKSTHFYQILIDNGKIDAVINVLRSWFIALEINKEDFEPLLDIARVEAENKISTVETKYPGEEHISSEDDIDRLLSAALTAANIPETRRAACVDAFRQIIEQARSLKPVSSDASNVGSTSGHPIAAQFRLGAAQVNVSQLPPSNLQSVSAFEHSLNASELELSDVKRQLDVMTLRRRQAFLDKRYEDRSTWASVRGTRPKPTAMLAWVQDAFPDRRALGLVLSDLKYLDRQAYSRILNWRNEGVTLPPEIGFPSKLQHYDPDQLLAIAPTSSEAFAALMKGHPDAKDMVRLASAAKYHRKKRSNPGSEPI